VSEIIPEPATAIGVPLQVLVNPFGVAITNPVGRVSLKATPASAAVLAAGLVIVIVSEVVPFTETPLAPNASLMVGGATTAKDAVLLAAHVPPSVEVTVLVVLLIAPATVPVTLRLMVHDPPAVRVPLVRFTEVEPTVAPPAVPLHVFVNAGDADTCRPPVSVSVKATPLKGFAPFGLRTVKVSVVDWLSGILLTVKALLIVGAPKTARVAVLLAAPAPL
jgi:hypothetical protein